MVTTTATPEPDDEKQRSEGEPEAERLRRVIGRLDELRATQEELQRAFHKNMAAEGLSDTERTKVLIDVVKHLTTLSSGAVVILISLLDKLPRPLHLTWLLGTSIGAFLCAVVVAGYVFLVVLAANHRRGRHVVFDVADTILARLVQALLTLFVSGVALLCVFAVANL